ncbi:MAG: serine hydrolase [Candidatus Heimdallarchaeota archaeon]
MNFLFKTIIKVNYIQYFGVILLTNSKTNTELDFAEFSKYAKSHLKGFGDAGIGIAFISNNKILFEEGMGYRDLEQKLPFTPETIFPIGSHTKSLTGTGIAMLVDDGLLTWDTPIVNYIPEFKLKDPFVSDRITIKDILSHTSGLPHHQFAFMNSEWNYKDVLKRIPHLDFAFDFRTRHKYANLNFIIATKIVEEISGMDYFKFMKKRILSPIGMKNTNFSLIEAQKSNNIAKGYSKSPEGLVEEPYIELKNIAAGAGCINSTLKDMGKWIQFLLNKGKVDDKELISEKTLSTMQIMQKLDANPFTQIVPGEHYIQNYGFALAWWSLIYRGLKMYQHYGTGPGLIFNGGFIPDANIGYVLFSNVSGSDLPFILNFYLADLIQGLEPIDWGKKIHEFGERYAKLIEERKKENPKKELPVKDTIPSRPLDQYVGIYTHPGYGELEFFLENNQLATRYGKSSEPSTAHYHYDTFTINVETLGQSPVKKYVTFRDNFDGVITHLEINAEPLVKPVVFTKINQ